MSEPYKIETPGRYIFNTIFLMSVAIFCLFEPGMNSTGVVLLVWGGLTLLRSIWMIETLLKTQRGTVRSRLLPWIILNGMERRKRANIAKRAYRIFNGPFMFWFLCSGLFLAGTIGENLLVDPTNNQSEASILITAFYEAEGLKHHIYNAADIQHMLVITGQLLTIGMAFFLAHTYAYTDHKSERLWWAPFFLFVLLMIAYLTFFGFKPPALPQSQKIFAYLAGAVPLWIFMRAWRHNRNAETTDIQYAQLGILCVCGLWLSDLFIDLPSKAPALWLSGWVSVSIFWARAQGNSVKIYRPHQI